MIENKVDIKKTVLNRCITRWEGLELEADGEYKDIEPEISALVRYFECVNNKTLKKVHKKLWIQLDTMLINCEVAIDGEAWDSLNTWIQCVTSLMWKLDSIVREEDL